jgi:3-methyladenine DNA glycosylase AlkD
MPMSEIQKLIESPWHEARLGACLVLVNQYKKADVVTRKNIYDFYLENAKRINNWDLVDSSAPHIVGRQLVALGDWSILKELARSENIWERRIVVLATMAFSDVGDSAPTYEIAEILVSDDHDLIHKAVGWMLREAGKRVSEQELELWLAEDGRYKTMPRTMLRYAIERLPETKRQQYLRGEI